MFLLSVTFYFASRSFLYIFVTLAYLGLFCSDWLIGISENEFLKLPMTSSKHTLYLELSRVVQGMKGVVSVHIDSPSHHRCDSGETGGSEDKDQNVVNSTGWNGVWTRTELPLLSHFGSSEVIFLRNY